MINSRELAEAVQKELKKLSQNFVLQIYKNHVDSIGQSHTTEISLMELKYIIISKTDFCEYLRGVLQVLKQERIQKLLSFDNKDILETNSSAKKRKIGFEDELCVVCGKPSARSIYRDGRLISLHGKCQQNWEGNL